MSKFVLIVDLEVKPESLDAFLEAAIQQVELTIRDEPGCHRFDIVRSSESETRFTHYEIFEDADAFQAHTMMPHTVAFRNKVEPLLLKTEIRSGHIFTSASR